MSAYCLTHYFRSKMLSVMTLKLTIFPAYFQIKIIRIIIIFPEQKAKEAELQRRQIARQAREEHRRSLLSTEKPFR